MMIFGLGNPGLRYRFTRHNAGYLFVERLAKYYRKRFLRRRNYAASYIRVKGVGIILVKPRCWMNQCGHVIREIICDQSKDFMVVVDDINLPVGRARLRRQGSDGGHLGLRSLIAELQTDSFPRLRIGVGRPDIDAAEYVLKRFTAEERKILLRAVNEAIKGVQIMVEHGFVRAQNHINAIKIE